MARPAYERVGAAFRAAYEAAGLRQEDIASALGVDQGTVSKWARGLQRIDLDYFPRIDDLCGRQRGHLLRLAGYVTDDPGDVLTAIANDPQLGPDNKRVMTNLYNDLKRSASSPSTRENDPSREMNPSH